MKKPLNLTLGTSLTALAILLAGTARAITLDECLRAALDGNPDTAAATARVDAARAAHEQTQAAYLPLVSLSGGYTQTDNPPQAFMMELNQRSLNMGDPSFDPNNPDATGNVRLSVGAKYRIYDGGRRSADRAMARNGVAAAEAGRDTLLNSLAYEVTRGYYGILQAQAFVGVQEESVKLIEESLRVANERFTAGTAVKTDVLNLDVKLAQAREDLIRARNSVKLATAALNAAIGRDLVPESGIPAPAVAALPDLPAAAPDAVEQRSELRAASAAARVREDALRRARREYVPTVSAFGSSDWDSPDLGGLEQSYLVGVMAEWDIFDGFRRPNAVREARATLAAAQAELQRARNQLKLDLQQSVLQAQEARERVGVTRMSVASAEESLRITNERYQKGASDLTELLTAQVGLTAIRNRGVAAYYDYLTAVSNVERAKGQLVKGTAR